MSSDFYQKYTNFSEKELLSKIKSKMSAKRFQHVLAVADTAEELARRFDVDVNLARIAGLVHDYAKERPDKEMIALILELDLDSELTVFGNSIWHGILGSVLIERELGITNSQILQAVAVHTTGSPEMSLLDKIIYVADYIEPNRSFEGIETVREIAQKNLDEAVKYEIKHTLIHLIEKEVLIFPKSLETYNACVTKFG